MKKKSAEKSSVQNRRRTEIMRRALVLLVAAVFLAGMPLASFMVSADEGTEQGGDAAVTGDAGAPQESAAPVSEPAAGSESDPNTAPPADPAAPVETAAVQQEQPVTYTAIWYDEGGSTELYRNIYEQVPNSGLYAGQQPVKAADENYTYTFSGWAENGSADGMTYTYTAQYTPEPIMVTVNWLNWDGTVFLSSDPFAKGGPEPTTDQKPAKEDAEYTYAFTGWGDRVWDEAARTITYTAQFTEAAKKETKFDLYPNPEDKANKLVVTVENIPVSAGLNMKEENAAEDKYKTAVEEILKTESASKKDCKEDTYLFALEFDPGAAFDEELTVNVQGKDLKDLPSGSLLYRVNVQEQNKIEKIDDYAFENTKNADTAEDEGLLTFRTKKFSIFVLVIPGADHSFDGGTVTKEPTCTQEGVKTFTCTNPGCTAEKTEPIAKTEHKKETKTTRVEATCEKGGVETTITRCSVCGAELGREEKKIPALGHKWDNGTVTQKPTCTKDGVKTFKCTNPGCKATKTEPVAKTGHKTETKTTQVDPTCEKEGVKTTITRCSVCGAELSREEKKIPALGHEWDNGVITKEPTTTAPGEKVYTCKRDKTHKKTETIPQLNPTAGAAKNDTKSITLNGDGETSVVSVTAENAPETANLSISSVDPSIVELVESSSISGVKYDVWFAVDINMGGNLSQNAVITVQSDKLANLPDGALLYHVNTQNNKVRKTSYTHSKGDNKLFFKSKEFSPFVILVKRGSLEAKPASSTEGQYNSPGYTGDAYYPAGDNGTWAGGGGWVGGFNETAIGGFNGTAVLGGMNGTDAVGFNRTGMAGFNATGVAGFNATDFAGENGTNTTGIVNMTNATGIENMTNTTGADNTTAANKTAAEDGSAGKGGFVKGMLIGILAAVVAAAAVAFGVVRYLNNGKRKE